MVTDKKAKLSGQRGFVLVAAIMALMIFIAVGFYALTVTTRDLRVSSRLVGERKAFSAAEAGVNSIVRSLNPNNLVPIVGRQVDPARDPRAVFDASAPARISEIPQTWLPGFGAGMVSAVFRSEVTGRDTSYGSQVRISVGMASVPGPGGTEQGPF